MQLQRTWQIEHKSFAFRAFRVIYGFEPLTLDSGASACDMSRRQFSAVFKKHVGMTWLQHLHRLRVKHAVELLKNTDRKITSIAFQCGFDDLTTFYRVMAKITGKRPGELRDAERIA